jgi:hypothetical protein
VEEALVVVDEERRALLLVEGREADELPALASQLHRAADHVGEPQAGLQFVDEAVVEAHAPIIPYRGDETSGRCRLINRSAAPEP